MVKPPIPKFIGNFEQTESKTNTIIAVVFIVLVLGVIFAYYLKNTDNETN